MVLTGTWCVSLCHKCLFLSEMQTAGVSTACAGGRVHLCNSSCLLIPPTVTQVLAMEHQPLHSKSTRTAGHSCWLVCYLFINRRFAPQFCLRGPFSPVSPPEVWDSAAFGIRSFSGVQDHKNARRHTHIPPMPSMNEWDCRDNESQRRNEGWSRGLQGPWQGRSYIDWFSKRILGLLVVLLNKSGL